MTPDIRPNAASPEELVDPQVASSVRMQSCKVLCAAIVACLAVVVGGTSFGLSQLLIPSSMREAVPALKDQQVSCSETTYICALTS